MSSIEELHKEIEAYIGNKYYDLQSIVDKHIKVLQVGKEEVDNEHIAEYLAFSLFPNNNGTSNWGTHYGPFATFKDGNGDIIDSPGKSYITKEIIAIWEERVKNTSNNFLKFRYLDVIYDLKFEITCENTDINLVNELIDTGISCLKYNLFSSLDGKFALQRILNIAIQYNKEDIIKNSLINLIISYEKQISEDDKPGLWGFNFDYLINNKKVQLEENIESGIVSDLEEKLSRLSDPFQVELCVNRLSEYYKNKGDYCNLLRVLNLLEKSFKNHEYSNSSGLLKANYYQKLIEKYTFYQNFPSIRIEKDRLINEFQKISKETLNSFQEFTTSFTITDEEMNNYIDFFFKTKASIISKIAVHQATKLDEVKKQLTDLANDYPLQYILNKQTFDSNGLPVYKFGNIDEDYDSHLYSLISQNLHIGTIFLDRIFERFVTVFTSEELILEILKCPLFIEEDKDFVVRIIENYYKGSYLEMNHLIVPFIEKTFRYLCEINGFTVINYNKNGSFEFKTLDSLINNEVIKAAFKERGEDFVTYFRIILTLKTGWNLRNNLAHGINHNYFFTKKVADRLLHILLCLSLIRFS